MSITKELQECPICFTCIDNDAISSNTYGCITNCKHYFHLKCLHRWTYTEDENNCPLCRAYLDMDLLDEQYALRRLLRMKQRQPNNKKIDDILFQLKHDRYNTLNWFCSRRSANYRWNWTDKIPRVPEEKPRKNKKNF